MQDEEEQTSGWKFKAGKSCYHRAAFGEFASKMARKIKNKCGRG